MKDDDPDMPLESDMSDSADESPLDDCPHCGKSIAEDSEWCHHCGKYLSREDSSRPIPLWVMIAATAAILAVLFFTKAWL